MCQTHKKQNFHGWGIDTISIVATSPRFGTIAKNHIQSSKVITRLLFFCSEYVTSLKNNTIKVHMSNIRSKLKKYDEGNEYIETVWGMGYRLVT